MFRSTLAKSLGSLAGITAAGIACNSLNKTTKGRSLGIHRSVCEPELQPAKDTSSRHVSTIEPKTMPDGSKYVGNLRNGKRWGQGESWDKMGHNKGTWVDDVKCGHGIFTLVNGFVYEGAFANNLPHGHGKGTFPNGKVLEGEFVNGILQNGSPRPVVTMEPMIRPDGSKYIGEQEKGKRCGEGESWDKMGHYKGTWVDDVKCGTGVLRYSNGRVYEGPFLNDLPKGRGKVTTRNGTSFNGVFVDGLLQHGGENAMARIEELKVGDETPPFIDVAGPVYEGVMINGKLNGQGRIIFNDGSSLEGVFCG